MAPVATWPAVRTGNSHGDLRKMSDLSPREYLEPARLFRVLLVAVMGVLAVYVEAAPLGVPVDAPPSPDLLLCLVAYWSIRRPGSIPMLLVFALGLFRDMVTDVPIGAGALSLILVSEGFKVWRRRLAQSMFLTEWLAVTAASLASTGLVCILIALTFAQPPYLTPLLNQSLFTAMVYPFLVLVLRWVLRVNWSRHQEATR